MLILSTRNTFCCLLACLFAFSVSAQEKLLIKGKVNDQYVVYVANGKETLQSISSGFGLSVTKLSSYNKININASKVFARGTEIKIPVTKNNLLQHAADNSAAVVHVIGKGENLYRVSQAYHKVPLASLREWNHLKKDIVKNGQEVIIGYMVNAKQPLNSKKESAAVADESARQEAVAPVPTDKKPDSKKDIATVSNKAIQSADKKTPHLPASVTPIVLSDDAAAAVEKSTVNVNGDYIPSEGDEGYFATAYTEHSKEQAQQFHSGDAAAFKTISGWSDRKFYVLMNDVAPKTIVRITGTANKSICAMVLGPLQETKGANGLLLRLSNSAVSALGMAGDKFTVTVTYFE